MWVGEINKEKQAAVPQKLLHELFDYNELTGGFVWIKKPHSKASRAKVGQVAGYINKRGYLVIRVNGYLCLGHRLAWTYMHGDYPEGKQPYIDHINGNPSDNRIINLKISSSTENQKNQKMNSRNTSGVTGVCRYEKVRPTGKIDSYWSAQWQDRSGKQRRKNFPIRTYGEEQAKQMATDFRVEQLHLLEVNFGIIYSDRHGL